MNCNGKINNAHYTDMITEPRRNRNLFKRTISAALIILIHLNAFSQDSSNCINKALGVVHFTTNKAVLTKASKMFLDSVFMQTKLHPACRIKVQSFLFDASERGQQEAWDRVYIVIWYLKKKGIDEQRFLFSYDDYGNQNITNVLFTIEGGPFMTPPPVPSFSTLRNISWKEVSNSYKLQREKQ